MAASELPSDVAYDPWTVRDPYKSEREADNVRLPKHYARWKIEPIHFIEENGLPFWMGNIIKYVMRHDAKNGLEDLKKARRYLDMKIAQMEGDTEWWR